MLAYTIQEACEHVSLSRSAFYKLLKDGVISAKKCGKRTLIPASDLQRWLDSLPPIAQSKISSPNPKAHQQKSRQPRA
jgi:excisionase family DNA binding protein